MDLGMTIELFEATLDELERDPDLINTVLEIGHVGARVTTSHRPLADT
jgi:hypothetical protein